jgi:hypothetical protein
MVLIPLVLLAVATVPLAGGRLPALLGLCFRATWVLWLALALQVAALTWPGRATGLHVAAHLSSYGLAGVFVWANHRVPGVAVLGLGGLLNALPIAANGGVMPARPGALAAAGVAPATDRFANSAAIEGARLPLLGDVFALPSSWPLATVFSAGDVVLLAGALVLLHRTCGSRLARRRMAATG